MAAKLFTAMVLPLPPLAFCSDSTSVLYGAQGTHQFLLCFTQLAHVTDTDSEATSVEVF